MAINAEAQETQLRGSTVSAAQATAKPSEFRSTFLMTGLKLVGKVLGIVKTLVIAAWFGASGALDAFWVAYMIPQIMPGLVLGVVSLAFIPSFMRSEANGRKGVDWQGLNTLFTLVTLVVIGIAGLVILARDPLVTLMAPGLPEDVHALAADLMGLMSIAVLLFGINSVLSAIMQAMHRFAVMSLESVITNVVIILGAVFLSSTLGVYGLVYAVIAGFGLHTLLLLWSNRDLIRYKLRPAFDYSHGDFRGSVGHMLPLLIGFLGSVGMTIVDRIFVSTLPSGAISILVYASMIALLPMEVFGHAVFTAFYPGLSRDHANGNREAMRESQVRGMRLLLFVLLPITAGLIMAAIPIVTLLLERGAFSAEDSRLTAMTLAALAIGLPVRAFNYFNFRVLHARREAWTAVSIGLFGVCVNILLDMLLIGPYGIVGIALATSIAMAACAVLSTFVLRRRQRMSVVRPLLRPMGKLLLMAVVFIAIAAALLQLVDGFATALPGWQRALLELSTFIPAGMAFLALGYWLKFEEVHTFLAFSRRTLRGRNA